MAELRAVTAECHARLERRLDLSAALVSVEVFRRLLERWYGFHRPLEERLLGHAADVPGLDVGARRKAHLLAADIRALGGTPSSVVEAGPSRLPAVRGVDEALGALYVVEGATLGAVVIGREARTRLGVHPGWGGGFLDAYGPARGARWRAFGAVVESRAGGRAPDSMLRAAVACFEAWERWSCD